MSRRVLRRHVPFRVSTVFFCPSKTLVFLCHHRDSRDHWILKSLPREQDSGWTPTYLSHLELTYTSLWCLKLCLSGRARVLLAFTHRSKWGKKSTVWFCIVDVTVFVFFFFLFNDPMTTGAGRECLIPKNRLWNVKLSLCVQMKHWLAASEEWR